MRGQPRHRWAATGDLGICWKENRQFLSTSGRFVDGGFVLCMKRLKSQLRALCGFVHESLQTRRRCCLGLSPWLSTCLGRPCSLPGLGALGCCWSTAHGATCGHCFVAGEGLHQPHSSKWLWCQVGCSAVGAPTCLCLAVLAAGPFPGMLSPSQGCSAL